jgi:uncharacterized protein YndB with AHSA1/START domain
MKGEFAMMELSSSIVINLPVEKVFTYMTTVKNYPNWMSELVEAKQTSEGPVGVGTTVSAVANVLGRRIENIQEVTVYKPSSKFAIKAASGPVKTEDEFNLESVAGGTKITRTTKGEFGGFFKMAEPLFVRMLKRQFETNFANLKDLLEAQA